MINAVDWFNSVQKDTNLNLPQISIYASNAFLRKIETVFLKSQIKLIKTFVINMFLAITVELNQSGEYGFNVKHAMILTSVRVLIILI